MLKNVFSRVVDMDLSCTLRAWAASVRKCCPDQIKSVHCQSEHLNVKRTLYFVRRIDPAVINADIKAVVRGCRKSQSTDPSPSYWKKRILDVSDTWISVRMDITHQDVKNYLTLIECGPTQFNIWQQLCQ